MTAALRCRSRHLPLLLAAALAACGAETDLVEPGPVGVEYTLVEMDGAPLPTLLVANTQGDSLFLQQERLTLDAEGWATFRRRVRDVRAAGIDTAVVQTWAMRYTLHGDSLHFASTMVCIRAPCGPQLRGRRVGDELALVVALSRGWDVVEIPARYRAVGTMSVAPD